MGEVISRRLSLGFPGFYPRPFHVSVLYVTSPSNLGFPYWYHPFLLQGLRWAIFLGALGTALGSWIKAVSVAPDRFWVTFTGQTFVAICQVFLLSTPPRLASVWFGSDQVSTACAIGVFGNQVGIDKICTKIFAYIQLMCSDCQQPLTLLQSEYIDKCIVINSFSELQTRMCRTFIA